MAMTKNIRITMNIISKLFSITNEAHKRMYAVRTANTIKDSIEASKALSNVSKRVDRLCDKLGFDREIVDEIYYKSEGCEDMFVLHILSINEYAFSAYGACIDGESMADSEAMEDGVEDGANFLSYSEEMGDDTNITCDKVVE